VAASWGAALGSEEAIKVQNILNKHRDDIFQQRADISRLGSFGTEMEDLIFRWRRCGVWRVEKGGGGGSLVE
jgi:hypothetical protein